MKIILLFSYLFLLFPALGHGASEDTSVQANAQASIRVVSSVSYDFEVDSSGDQKLNEFYTRTRQSVTISGKKEQVNTSSNEEGVVKLHEPTETVEIIF